jgi:hypothetical protein
MIESSKNKGACYHAWPLMLMPLVAEHEICCIRLQIGQFGHSHRVVGTIVLREGIWRKGSGVQSYHTPFLFEGSHCFLLYYIYNYT